jgi:LPS export ABC transporter protein LptC
MKRILILCIGLLSVTLLVSCEAEVDASLLEAYLGPISEAYDIDLYHSDSAIVRTHLKAKKQVEFESGDFEFPEGIEIVFFDIEGNVTTTMSADKGFYIRKDNIYRGEGNVNVKNLEKDQSLASEELFWDPNSKKIYTEKFVTVQEKETIFNGTGMEADENFTDYKLFKITNSRTILPGEGT